MTPAAARVVWQAAARSDLRVIFRFLLPRNPAVAERVVQGLGSAAESLASFPLRGRPGRTDGTRELTAFPPYILVYEVRGDTVVILRIWHGAQNRA